MGSSACRKSSTPAPRTGAGRRQENHASSRLHYTGCTGGGDRQVGEAVPGWITGRHRNHGIGGPGHGTAPLGIIKALSLRAGIGRAADDMHHAVTRSLDHMDEEGSAQQPGRLGRFLTEDRPGCTGRQIAGESIPGVLPALFVAQGGVQSAFRAGVTQKRIIADTGEHNYLIGIDNGSIQIEPLAAQGRGQVTKPLSVRGVVNLQMNFLEGIRQLLEPFLVRGG